MNTSTTLLNSSVFFLTSISIYYLVIQNFGFPSGISVLNFLLKIENLSKLIVLNKKFVCNILEREY